MKEAGAPAGLFVAAMKGLAIGNPMDAGTQLGPLAAEAIRDELFGPVAHVFVVPDAAQFTTAVNSELPDCGNP